MRRPKRQLSTLFHHLLQIWKAIPRFQEKASLKRLRNNPSMFRRIKKSVKSRARFGRLATPHGALATPFFMPVATRGSLKSLDAQGTRDARTEIVLSNTYHLLNRPGYALLEKCGGLHAFMGWNGPILTDSGGYQVFSLARHRKIAASSVSFKDPQTGKTVILTPYNVLKMQRAIGSDIMMVLDVCPPYPSEKEVIQEAIRTTTAWAKSSIMAYRKLGLYRRKERPLLFAITQGGVYDDLRAQHAQTLAKMPFDGYAIGGLAVGEPREKMYHILTNVVQLLPEDKPRYLMGVGKPQDIMRAVQEGVDMFDCVIPTREARHGRIYVFRKRERITATSAEWYETYAIRHARHQKRLVPIDPTCGCFTCGTTTIAYMHHLFRVHDPLAERLATIHNIYFYNELMRLIRRAIRTNDL
ncbi:MAG: tRNA guanosine(34) transglycosylase Tgt [Parcubacteria group bacterium CG08_land_8_20_14_0_20_48_21]|nr:MAG: tRNA guanosine(34) transglycosylase Tgt [Parcubacteria group bacterium CG08_land_8_20_14_0_20_48_21]PIW78887.1 MAG: tRNA guanosine(34) transglycosylase Tgt [Parcubacteria group bacterium CG_4_8_14_3_um_filter_48_16]PIY77931.1 MAG: tRNA guanosine(34) transglycosylase Tgt [Parcubacteria group bacterium CG_4_10_14_0_8_um_filter_48_154]PJC39597.1 MAG: tRNA guanosine(34) transglycosylase Tgt [Parcubacteria group bacterium CG_4_9_14_0_2_um_filter_48_40]